MAWITHSHSLLTDCLFDAADLVMIGPFLVLLQLLCQSGPACEVQRSAGTDM